MTRATILASLAFAVCCMTLSVFYVRNAESRIRARIKQEVKEEMGHEIRLAVAKAMSSYTATVSATSAAATSAAVSTPGKENPVPVRLASTQDMDFYVAGAMDSSVPISGGMTKEAEAPAVSAAPAEKPKKNEKKKDVSYDSVVAGKAAQGAAIDRTMVDKGGMLLPKGTTQFEPSFTVAHFSSNRVNIQGFSILTNGGGLNFGLFTTDSVKRDVFIPAVTLRRGMLRNFQGEIKIPFRYEYDRVTSNAGTETCRYDYGLGDIELSLSRQIAWERGIIPDTVASFTVKTPTGGDPYNDPIGLGTGHWGFKGALVAVKSSDPAVVFGSINYTYNLPKDVDLPGFGEVAPGNTLGYSLGTAIGLSYQTAINFAFEQYVTYKMSINGHNVKGTFLNAADLKAGFTWAISEKATLNFSVAVGITTDAPDYVAEVTFPITF